MSDWPFGDLTPFKYGAILADPPWDHIMRSDKGKAKSPSKHYDTMTLEEIKAMPVSQLAGPHCMLFLWSTWPHLLQAAEVMSAWGFAYSTGGAWTKRTVNWKLAFGTGYVLRSASEPFLVGRMNSPEIRSKSVRNAIVEDEEIPDLIDALRREHSRKPVQIREMIGQLLPRQHAVELFARTPWPGHAVWGNEVHRFAESADE